MTSPIVALHLAGFFVSSKPWTTAHDKWWDVIAEELNDPSVIEWREREDYFHGVDQVMRQLHPSLSEEERTVKAREKYFALVLEELRSHPEWRNERAIEYVKSLKPKARIALLTTTTEDITDEVLRIIDLEDFFDIKVASKPEEKDDKEAVFDRFMAKYSRPAVYIGGDRRQSFEYCRRHRIPAVFANFENGEPIEGVKNVNTLEELEMVVDKQLH